MTQATITKINWLSRILIVALLGGVGWIGNLGTEAIQDNTAAIGDLGERMARVETLLNDK